MPYQFTCNDYFIEIDEHSEGGYYYSIYQNENDYNNGDDDIEGGLCTSDLSNTIHMAVDTVINLTK